MNLLAQNLDIIQSAGMPSFVGGAKLGDLIKNLNIFVWIFYASAFLLLIYLLTGGLQLMLSRGDPKAVAGAWGKITNAVIGFLIVFGSYFIVRIVGQVFGIAVFKDIFG